MLGSRLDLCEQAVIEARTRARPVAEEHGRPQSVDNFWLGDSKSNAEAAVMQQPVLVGAELAIVHSQWLVLVRW